MHKELRFGFKVLVLHFLFVPLFSSLVSGQKVKELEQELHYNPSRHFKEKIHVARELHSIDPFNAKAIEFICDYYKEEQIDSLDIFFNNLTSRYPKSPTPLILRSEMIRVETYSQESREFNSKMNFLKLALALDSSNLTTIYLLATGLYKRYIDSFLKTNDAIRALNHPAPESKALAESALKYFYIFWKIDSASRDVLYFPIRQLESYLNIKEYSPIPTIPLAVLGNCFFPVWFFTDLKENWESQYSEDYLYLLGSSGRRVRHISDHLSDLKEPCFYRSGKSEESPLEIYRVTWLRSFDKPVVVRVEKNKNGITLFWKVGNGQGGFDPEGIMISGQKKFRKRHWNQFVKLLNESDFQNLPAEIDEKILDGESFVIEQSGKRGFKAHKTNSPSAKLNKSCFYLMKKTGIKIRNRDGRRTRFNPNPGLIQNIRDWWFDL